MVLFEAFDLRRIGKYYTLAPRKGGGGKKHRKKIFLSS